MKMKRVDWIGLVAVLAIASLCLGLVNYSQNKKIIELASEIDQLPEKLLKSNGIEELTQSVRNLSEDIHQDEQVDNGVKAHGNLYVEKANLLDQQGDPVQLQGFSSHGLMWYPEYINYSAMETIRRYGANVMRIAVYTETSSGYVNNGKEVLGILYQSIENVLAADLYAIVDWHVLEDNNPLINQEEAVEFFDLVSMQYANHPGVIYEICNEPNGDTTWADIKSYSEIVIPVIRKNSPSALILVGTPNYSTDIESVYQDPLTYEGVMYSYHQYIDENSSSSRSTIEKAQEFKLPLFVSEWGVNNRNEDIELSLDKAEEFLLLLDEYSISWVNWSLSNKLEGSAAIQSEVRSLSGWTLDELSRSGRFVFQHLDQ